MDIHLMTQKYMFFSIWKSAPFEKEKATDLWKKSWFSDSSRETLGV